MPLTLHTFRSRALLKKMRLQIYTPPHYKETAAYPLALLLHPWGADETFWATQLNLPAVADRLINGGALPPFIAVMPQGDKSFFINAAAAQEDFSFIIERDPVTYDGALAGCGDYGDYIIQDVLAYTEKAYNTQQRGRVLAGMGMGATGAAVLALTYSGSFGALAMHSPTLYPGVGYGPPWIFGMADERSFARRDPLTLITTLPEGASAMRIYLEGAVDDALIWRAHDLLTERRIPHTFVQQPDSADVTHWRAHLAEYLGFYAAGW